MLLEIPFLFPGLTPEINPKWDCLKEILAEVRASAAKSEGPLVERCLIVTQDDTSAQQLQQVRGQHARKMLYDETLVTLSGSYYCPRVQLRRKTCLSFLSETVLLILLNMLELSISV